jgi:5-methylcytosine-specific restriction endonuclease McrA
VVNTSCRQCGKIISRGSRGLCYECNKAKARQRETTRPSPRARGYDSAWERLAAEVKRRDGCCLWPGCGATENLQADHIVPMDRGGTNDMSNLQTLCAHHHGIKTALDQKNGLVEWS